MRHMTSAFVMVLALALAGCATHGALPALPPLHADAAAEIVVIREARIFGAGLTFYITLDRTPVYARGNDQHAVIPMAAGQHLLGIAAGGWNGGVKLIQPTAQQRLYCRVNSAPVTTGLSLEAVSADAGQALMAKTSLVR